MEEKTKIVEVKRAKSQKGRPPSESSKKINAAFRYLATQSDNMSIYQLVFIDSLRKQWKRRRILSEKQQGALFGIHDSIKDLTGEI